MVITKCAAIAIAAMLLAIAGSGMERIAHAQTSSLQPQNIRAVNGTNLGEVTITWDGVEGAQYYRIGWAQIDELRAVMDAGRPWTDAFYHVDAKAPTTIRTITGLSPGFDYLFLVGGQAVYNGEPEWGLADPWPITLNPFAAPVGDYDADNDGLIEITTLDQLDVIRYDTDGNGDVADQRYVMYTQAFVDAVYDMGCGPGGCVGYELTADLDFDTNRNGIADAGDTYWNGGKGWEPIGRPDNTGAEFRFATALYGNGHTVAHLYINRPEEDYVGLFDRTVGDTVIYDLTLADVNVTGRGSVGSLAGRNDGGEIYGITVSGTVSGSGNNIGGLLGSNRVGGLVADSYSTASVSGDRGAGGLVGHNRGASISNSAANGTVAATDEYAGGLVGAHAEGGVIVDSRSAASVSGGRRIGGLVGQVFRASNIVRSHASGTVTASEDDAGGLAGRLSTSTVIAGYATGDVTGTGSNVGGLVGEIHASVVYGSFATGDVAGRGSGEDTIGGLAGHNRGRIYRSYATGEVSGGDGDHIGGLVGSNDDEAYIYLSYARGRVSKATGTASANLGGLVGSNAAEVGHISASYWDTETSGQLVSAGGESKTTAELQNPTDNTGIYEHWDRFWWDFGTASQYPVLRGAGLDPDAQR